MYKMLRGEEEAPNERPFPLLVEYNYIMAAPSRALMIDALKDVLVVSSAGNTGSSPNEPVLDL